MVGHVIRDKNKNQRSAEPPAPVLTPNNTTAPAGEVHGTAEIRGPNGELKGTFTFGGSTELTREELEQKLGMTIPGGD